ncbi:thioredoxin domain-containing protein [Ectothiorhodospiraceae bacterium 2226]|nr:thioredoxin domain-containing protein [Ectothiorhodospiraceae bacterium 2226]
MGARTGGDTQRNRLASQTSPYLLQHADNPVDWYPWGEEALARARDEGKPILLSIGYSACHWCHVMAHESFEDPETAEVMNALFVNIKVDREERPDLDKIYQTAHQLIIGRGGGWPLTMFLTPEDLTPFFGGTYFPVKPRHGLPSFADVLRRVAAFYRENREEIDKQNTSLRRALATLTERTPDDVVINDEPLAAARRQLGEHYDVRYGGFGNAPKFPHPTNVEVLLRRYAHTRANLDADYEALDMARTTLHAMASGGLYDQLGGGFCRYSVDERWQIPHFEKMLYDNGPLLALYTQGWQATDDDAMRRVALEVAEWAMREMQAPEGGFYATLDADSEGEEGKFYAWTRTEAQALLSPDEYRILAPHYGLDDAPNFEGRWHLHVARPLEDVAEEAGLSLARARELLASARHRLFEAREQRERPGRDEKILTAWNALMIKGMAMAGRVFERPDLLDSAERALGFIRTELYRDGRLLASYKDGRAQFNAYLDDYVFLIDAVVELLQARWRDADMTLAMALADALLAHFQDRRGGFYFTSHDHENLIHRPKPMADDATPAGNGVAAQVLGRLGHLLGDTRYLEAAERTLKAAWREMNQMPYAYGALLIALEEYAYPLETVVVRAPQEACAAWRRSADYAPRRLQFCIPAEAQALPGALAQRAPRGAGVAYLCRGQTCSAPLESSEALGNALAGAPLQ